MGFRENFDRLFRGSSKEAALNEYELLYHRMQKEVLYADQERGGYTSLKLSDSKSYADLKSRDHQYQQEFLTTLIHTFADHLQTRYNKRSWHRDDVMSLVVGQLLRTKLPLSETQIIGYLLKFNKSRSGFYYIPYKSLLRRAEELAKEGLLSEGGKASLKKLNFGSEGHMYADERDLARRVEELVTGDSLLVVNKSDDFGIAFGLILSAAKGKQAEIWKALTDLWKTGMQKARPGKKWLQEVEEQIDKVDRDNLAESLRELLLLAEQLIANAHKTGDTEFMHPDNLNMLRSMVWTSLLLNDDDLSQAVERLGLMSFKKMPGVGGLSVKTGNACLYALSELPEGMGIARLTKFRQKIKLASVHKQVDALISKVAQRQGKSVDEVEEMAVPDFGLDDQNCYQEQLGEFTALIRPVRTDKAELVWLKKEGREQKTVPSVLKEGYAEEIKALKRKVREIQSALSAQRNRIESIFLRQRVWTLKDWTDHYHQHGLVSFIANKLIWTFTHNEQSVQAFYFKGSFVDHRGEALPEFHAATMVSLWHPIGEDADYVLDWRIFLLSREIQQPFKQAYREVYVVTDAELNTRSYSNRFAAHVLRQHQMAALCQQRNWRYHLMGAWDGHNIPYLELPLWNMEVQFWIEGNWNDVESSINDAGIFNYVFTDQVRFYRDREQVNVDTIEPIVFSEAMRDVDLFVGVTSIGNDPNWVDSGNEPRYNAYWSSYSFGDLSATAQMRKEVLERLIPRLKIADRCSFEGKFLVVEGKIRTYKIHLGSSNILMKPNDEYLCIVEERSKAGEKVFLPFDNDKRLSMILSKAFLLAADDKIKDTTILRQIRR